MDIKQLRAFRTFRQQRIVRTSRRKGFSGSGHQGDEDKRDIKQQRILWNQVGTSAARDERGGGRARRGSSVAATSTVRDKRGGNRGADSDGAETEVGSCQISQRRCVRSPSKP